jgi:hypothetical protein
MVSIFKQVSRVDLTVFREISLEMATFLHDFSGLQIFAGGMKKRAGGMKKVGPVIT